MDSDVAKAICPSYLWTQARIWYDLLPWTVRNNMTLTINAFLSEFGEDTPHVRTLAQMGGMTKSEAEQLKDIEDESCGNEVFFPSLPTLKFKEDKFLNLEGRMRELGRTVGTVVYGTTKEVDHVGSSTLPSSPASQTTWINLKSKIGRAHV